MMIEFDDEYEYIRPNKSQLKREAQALLDLAKKLVEIPEGRWVDLSMPTRVIEALQDFNAMRQYGAQKRQLKLIAKCLRDVDVSLAAVALDDMAQAKAKVDIAFHRIERWRDKLLAEGAPALTSFMQAYPHAEVQVLNQLLRNAKHEVTKNKPLKSSKLLFKLIKEIMDTSNQLP